MLEQTERYKNTRDDIDSPLTTLLAGQDPSGTGVNSKVHIQYGPSHTNRVQLYIPFQGRDVLDAKL